MAEDLAQHHKLTTSVASLALAVAQDATITPDPLTIELQQHANTLRHYLHYHTPATTVDAIVQRLRDETSGITLVTGRVGQLTQVALAHALQQSASFKPDTVCRTTGISAVANSSPCSKALLIRCITTTAASSSLLSLLQSVCQQVCSNAYLALVRAC